MEVPAMTKESFLYKQVYDGIKLEIMNGSFTVGEKLPPDEILRTKYNVSNITIKKAMDLLHTEGYIRRVPGRGTYVLAKSEDIEQTKHFTAPTKMIGLVLEHVTTPFGLDMLYELDQRAEEAGFKLCIRYSYGIQEKETEEIHFLLSLKVSGLIIMPCHGDHYNTTLLRLIIEKFPVVLIDKRMDGIPVPSVRTNNRAALCQMVSHLAQSGCRHIGLITVSSDGTTSLQEREEGFYQGIKKYGLNAMPNCNLAFSPHYLLENCTHTDHTSAISAYLIKLGNQLDAVVLAEFGLVPSFVEAANKLNISIGSKLKACCIDEDYLNPNGYLFTHMRQDEKEIANQAIKLLFDKINGLEIETDNYEIPALFRLGATT